MSLAAALEALRGNTYQEILGTLRAQTEPAIGKIQGANLKLLQSFIGATGLRNRLANAASSQPAAVAAIAEAIQPAYLAMQDSYSINLADPQVAALMAGAVTAGILTSAESEYLQSLATYDRQLWPDVTMRDVVAHFEPSLLDLGYWTVLDDVIKNRLLLRLASDLPEQAAVRIEMQESHDGTNWTAWRRVAHFMGVQAAGIYYQQIPNNGLHRRVRVRGEQYRINATVEAV